MRRRITRAKIKNSFVTLFGIDRLTGQFLTFSKAHLCFLIATNIHGIFINILLMRVSGDINVTLYYNMLNYTASGAGMLLGGALIKRFRLKYITFLGIGFHLIAYLLFLFFMQGLASFYLLVACLLGLGGGCFWYTYLNAISLYSEDESRDVSIAFLGIFSSIIALIVPAAAGTVIGSFEGYSGYTVMFAGALLVSGISLYLFTKLPDFEPDHSKTRYLYCVKRIFTNKCWFYDYSAICLRCVRDGIFAFFLNVLLFEYVQNETLIGLNTLLTGFISIIAQAVCGKTVNANNRIKSMFIATTALTVSTMVLFASLNAVTIIILSVMNAFFAVLLLNPASAVDFSVIQAMPDGYTCRGEFLGISEMVRAVGRCAGLTLLLVFPKNAVGYTIALLMITVLQYLTTLCASKAQRESRKQTCETLQEPAKELVT